MNTANTLYQHYKSLPKRVRQEFKTLLEKDKEEKNDLLSEIEQGLKEVKLMQEGKLPKRSLDDLLNELRSEQ